MPRNHQDWIAAYLEYTAATEAPLKFHFWVAVSVLAGALERKVWIDQKFFQWVPNFYIIFVGPPGIISKSTTADIGMSLLREVPEIKFGPNSLTWQSLTKSLSECTRGLEDRATGEIYPMSAMTIVASELGSLLNFEDREMIDVFVDLWDGKRGVWERKTKTSGEDRIENVWINILGCTTPAWIRRNFDRYLLGGGFTSRTIFVYGNEKRNLEAYPGDRIEDKLHAERKQKLVEDLQQIAQIFGPMTLDPEAKAWGKDWYEKHYARYRTIDPNDEGLASFMARKQTQMHKLAMVLSASRRDSRIITTADLQQANLLMDAVEADLPEIFGRIAERDEVQDAVAILQVLLIRKSMERQSLYRLLFNRMTAQQFDSGLMSLIAAGKARQHQEGNNIIVSLKEEPKSG